MSWCDKLRVDRFLGYQNELGPIFAFQVQDVKRSEEDKETAAARRDVRVDFVYVNVILREDAEAIFFLNPHESVFAILLTNRHSLQRQAT